MTEDRTTDNFLPESFGADGYDQMDMESVSERKGNPYRIRVADERDLRLIQVQESEIAGLSTPAPLLTGELEEGKALYIVAVRDIVPEEAGAVEKKTASKRRVAGFAKNIGKLFTQPVTQNPTEPLDGERLAGFAGIWHVSDRESHIISIAVSPSERGKGVGELLLISTIEEAMAKDLKAVTLEVRRSNDAAKKLYRKYKFVDVGIRKNYYSGKSGSPDEDAIRMSTPPICANGYKKIFSELVGKHEEKWSKTVTSRPFTVS